MRRLFQNEALSVSILLTLAALIRIPFCLIGNFDLTYDNAMVAVMGREIFDRFYFTPFFYGYAYSGTIETVFTGLSQIVFGIQKFSVYAPVLAIHLATLYMAFLLAKECFGKICAFIFLILLVIPSWPPLFYGVYARVVYATTPFFSITAIYLTLKIIKTPSLGTFRWFGLIYGLAWWNHSLIIYAMVTSALLFLIYRPRLFTSLQLWTALPWFLFGSLPFWLFNLCTQFASFDLLSTPRELSFLRGLKNVLFLQIPRVFMQSPIKNEAGHLFWAQHIYLIILICGILLALIKACSDRTQRKGLGVMILACTATWIIFAANNLARFPLPRYILPSYYYLLMIAAAGLGFLYTLKPKWSFTLLTLCLCLRAWVVFHEGLAHQKQSETKSQTFEHHILTPLLDKGLLKGITPFWAVAPALDFFSRGQLQIASNRHERDYKKFLLSQNESDLFFMHASGKADWAEYIRALLPATFRIPIDNEAIQILDQFTIDPAYSKQESVDHSNVSALLQDSHTPFYLSDRNYQTIEHTRPVNDAFEIGFSLNTPDSLACVRFLPLEDSFFGHALDIEAWVMNDQNTWHRIRHVQTPLAVYTEGSRMVFNEEEALFEIPLPSTPVKAFKLISAKPLSFREVFVYRVSTQASASEIDIPPVIRFLSDQGFKTIFTLRSVASTLKSMKEFKHTHVVLPPNKSVWLEAPHDDALNSTTPAPAIVLPAILTGDLKHLFSIFGVQFETHRIGHLEIIFNLRFRLPLNFKWLHHTLCLNENVPTHFLRLHHLSAIRSNEMELKPIYSKLLKDLFPYLPGITDHTAGQEDAHITHSKLETTVRFSDHITLSRFTWLDNKDIDSQAFPQAQFEFVTSKTQTEKLAFFIHFKSDDQVIHQEDFFGGHEQDPGTPVWIPGLPVRFSRSMTLPREFIDKITAIEMGIWRPTTTQGRLKIEQSSLEVTPHKTVKLPLPFISYQPVSNHSKKS